MSRWYAVALALAIASVLAVPMAASGIDAPPAEPDPLTGEVTIYGYVANLSDQERNTPLEGVSVTLYRGSTATPVGTTETDADGRFEFTFTHASGDLCYLFFEYAGYTVKSLPNQEMNPTDNGYIQFQLQLDWLDDQGDFALTGPATGPHAIVMAITTGNIYGVVRGESGDREISLSGARVTLVSENGQNYTATTDVNGYFQIECPYGAYTMTVSCNGFSTSEETVVETNYDGAYTVTLVRNSSEVFLGLDSAHAMMVVGLVILAIMLVAAALVSKKSSDPESRYVLENDLPLPETEDGEEVRHP